jgi:prevent-host-death family protein
VAKAVSVGEAKARLSNLINLVAFGGERIVIESRGRPKAALVSLDDLRRLDGAKPARASRAQRESALIQADRVRTALKGVPLTDSTEDLARLRRGRLDAIS